MPTHHSHLHRFKSLFLLTLVSSLSLGALAQSKVGFQNGDTPATVLQRQTGQRVELRLKSGDKIAGKVEAVGEKAVHLSALSGQEFFDAVVVLEDISAVVVRTGK
jgi:hypothetical protein